MAKDTLGIKSGVVSKNEMKRIRNAVKKQSGFNKTAAGISMATPTYYNPLFSQSSLQLPRDRKQINVWSFAPDTKILMADGTQKAIEKIEIGELVISGNGNIRPITHKYKTPVNKTMVTVTTDQSSLSITHDHGCYVVENKDIEKALIGDIETFVKEKYASELKEGDWLFRPVNAIKIDGSLDRDLAYLLGAYLAEGYPYYGEYKWFDKERNKTRGVNRLGNIELKYDLNEQYIVNKVVRLCEKLAYPVTVKKASNVFRVYINSPEFTKLCVSYCGRGSKTKKLSKELLYANGETLSSFMSGYIDGDGHQSKENGRISFATASKNLADQFDVILPKLGIIHGRNDAFVKAKASEEKRHYAVYFRVPRRYTSIFTDCAKSLKTDGWIEHLSNKRKIKNNLTNAFYQIKKIDTKEYIGNVFDITVEKDFNLIAANIAIKNCRHFVQTEAIPAAVIDLYAYLPITGYTIECTNPYVKKFFEDMCERLDVRKTLQFISYEYWIISDVFAMGELDQEKKTWKRFVILNPDQIEVRRNVLADTPIIELIPDDDMKKVIFDQEPRELYNYFKTFLPEVIMAVRKGENIPIDPAHITHFRHNPTPYGVYGTPLLKRIFKTLMYKEMIRRAQFVIAERYVTPLKIFKLGTMDEPPPQAEIDAMQAQLEAVLNDPALVLVTSARLTADWQGIGGKTLNLGSEYDFLEREMVAGLGVSRSLLDSLGPTYNSSVIGGNAFIQKLENFRTDLKKWVEDRIFKPICELNDFYDEDPDTDERFLIKVGFKWEPLRLQDEGTRQTALLALRQSNILSAKTLLSSYNIEAEAESANLYEERDTIFDMNRALARQIMLTQGTQMAVQAQFSNLMSAGMGSGPGAAPPGTPPLNPGQSGVAPPSAFDFLSGGANPMDNQVSNMAMGSPSPNQQVPFNASGIRPPVAAALNELLREVKGILQEDGKNGRKNRQSK